MLYPTHDKVKEIDKQIEYVGRYLEQIKHQFNSTLLQLRERYRQSRQLPDHEFHELINLLHNWETTITQLLGHLAEAHKKAIESQQSTKEHERSDVNASKDLSSVQCKIQQVKGELITLTHGKVRNMVNASTNSEQVATYLAKEIHHVDDHLKTVLNLLRHAEEELEKK